MKTPEELLDLTRRGARSFRTVRFVLRHTEPHGELAEAEWRVTYAPPDRLREEVDSASYSAFEITDGRRRWWSFNPRLGEALVDDAGTAAERPARRVIRFLDASRLLREMRVESVEQSTFLGRSTFAVHGTTRGEGHDARLEIDAERGVLLVEELSKNSELVERREVVEIVFDEELPDEIFTYVPPPGWRLRDYRQLQRELDELPRTIEESAPLMPFQVWVLPEASGWTLGWAMPAPPSREHGPVPYLHLDYDRFDEGGEPDWQRVNLWEWALSPEEPVAEGVRLESEAGPFIARSTAGGERASVLATIGGTRIQLIAFGLAEAELRQLTELLVPYPA